MKIDPRSIINSRLGIGLALMLGRSVPPGIGYRVAYFMADRVAARKQWDLVRAARANQWVASQETLSATELDQAVRDTFHNIAHSIYNLYHYHTEPAAIERLFTFNPLAQQIADRQQTHNEGALVVGMHLSNFDLAFQALYTFYFRNTRALALTLPEMKGGYRWQYEMRQNAGIEIVPTTPATLRQAVERLRSGGIVMTGLDRPFPAEKYRPRFFGRPASLPVHHVYLALKTRAPIYVAAISMRVDGTYALLVSDPISMCPDHDRKSEIIVNAETVLRVAEGFIRQAPRQWAMTFPVWPEALEQVP